MLGSLLVLPQFPFLVAEPGAGTRSPPCSFHGSTANSPPLVHFPFGSWVLSPCLRAGNCNPLRMPWEEPAGLAGMCTEASHGEANATLHYHPLHTLSLAGPGDRRCSAGGGMPRAGEQRQLELL